MIVQILVVLLKIDVMSCEHIRPKHYQTYSKEVWEMMIDIWGEDAFITYCEINAFKYRMRAGEKEGQPAERDIDKAKWYEDKAKELKQKSVREYKQKAVYTYVEDNK